MFWYEAIYWHSWLWYKGSHIGCDLQNTHANQHNGCPWTAVILPTSRFHAVGFYTTKDNPFLDRCFYATNSTYYSLRDFSVAIRQGFFRGIIGQWLVIFLWQSIIACHKHSISLFFVDKDILSVVKKKSLL